MLTFIKTSFIFSCIAIPLIAQISLNQWTLIEIDNNNHGRWFGIAMGDLNGDGKLDLASGSYIHFNPGGNMQGNWSRHNLSPSADVIAILDVDDDGKNDIIGVSCNSNTSWFKAPHSPGEKWQRNQVNKIRPCDHSMSTQGYAILQIFEGGKAEIILMEKGVRVLQIPPDPTVTPWPDFQITVRSTVGISTADVDNPIK